MISNYGLSLPLWLHINDSLSIVLAAKEANSCVTATKGQLPGQKVKLDPQHPANASSQWQRQFLKLPRLKRRHFYGSSRGLCPNGSLSSSNPLPSIIFWNIFVSLPSWGSAFVSSSLPGLYSKKPCIKMTSLNKVDSSKLLIYWTMENSQVTSCKSRKMCFFLWEAYVYTVAFCKSVKDYYRFLFFCVCKCVVKLDPFIWRTLHIFGYVWDLF